MTERAYDPSRLRRARERAVERLGPNQFRVQGAHRKYYDVNLDLDTPCDCEDAYYHGRGCLHELAARLQAGDTRLILALGFMLLADERRQERVTT